MSLTKCNCECGCKKGTEFDICVDCANDKHVEQDLQEKLNELMSSSYAKMKIIKLVKKMDVPFHIGESMFRETLKKMLEDKNTDWNLFKVDYK